MSETIALTTPAQINMWVLLSRRAQLHLQITGKGKENAAFYRTPGLLKWCKANIGPECTTAEKALLRVNEVIAEAGGPNDPKQHVLVAIKSAPDSDYALDAGVYPNMEAVEANPQFMQDYADGCLELMLTNDPVRPPKAGLMYHFNG